MQSWVQWSGYRLAILHTMLLKQIDDILALGEEKTMIGAIPVNFKAQELSSGS